jgi:hypothetical protein
MALKSDKLPLSDLDYLVNLATEADKHAAALGAVTRQIYDGVLAAKAKNGNRGPSGIILYNNLQRAAAKHFCGTPILRMQRGSHPSIGGFRQQVESWLPQLTSRGTVIQPITPPADRAA